MAELISLWLPIVLATVIVFVASSIIHMAPLWHKNDYPRVPNEDRLLDAIRQIGLPPGDYFMPRCESSEQMKSPEFAEKMKKGPVLLMTVIPSGAMTVGRSLVLWLLYCAVVGIFAGYVASAALDPGAHYLKVFQIVGATAFVSYSLALWQMSIWFRRGWALTVKATFDGLIYACLTAGTFGWLWPK